MPMKFCVVGCGALGSVFAAHLAKLPDVEVHAYDASEENVRAINERGLRISGAVDWNVKLHATRDPGEIPRCDFGIFAAKSGHTRAAVEQTARIFSGDAAVCSVQNGLGNEEVIAERVKYVIRGATTMAAHTVAPGHAGFEFYSELWIGPFEPSGTPFLVVEKFAETLNRSGLRVKPLRDARGAQWTKLIFNAAVNPVGALTRLHHGAAARFAPTAALFEALLQEGEAVARAQGIELYGDPRKMVEEGASGPEKRFASMSMDAWAKRETEIDFLNGAVADVGEKLGVPVPLNRAMWQLIKGVQHSWSDPG